MSRATKPSAPTAEISYEEYMAMPESNRPVEVIDGVLFDMPTPTIPHQIVIKKLTRRLDDACEAYGLVVQSPSDVFIRMRPKLRVRQPDLMVYLDDRCGFHAADDGTRITAERIPPSVAIEVLSPGQSERTLADKLRDYASIGILEVWFADRKTRSIRVLGLDGDGYRLVNEYSIGDRVISAVLPGLDLPVASIFG